MADDIRSVVHDHAAGSGDELVQAGAVPVDKLCGELGHTVEHEGDGLGVECRLGGDSHAEDHFGGTGKIEFHMSGDGALH